MRARTSSGVSSTCSTPRTAGAVNTLAPRPMTSTAADTTRRASRQTVPVIRYLSLEWLEALRAAVAASPAMQAAADGGQLGVTQVVVDGPEGEVTYHLQVGDHSARFGVGPAEPEDVRFVQDWATAVAVATGRLNAQDAFMGGRIRLTGDQQKLLDSQDVFRALDAVFTSVRAETEYR